MTQPKNAEEKFCPDCGQKIVTGRRCRTHNGAFQRLEAAALSASEDEELLGMVFRDQLSAQRLGDRLGISRVAAQRRIDNAERRQEILRGYRITADGQSCWCILDAPPTDDIVHQDECDRHREAVAEMLQTA